MRRSAVFHQTTIGTRTYTQLWNMEVSNDEDTDGEHTDDEYTDDGDDGTVEEMVKANRRPSSRDGFVLEVGFLVRHVESHLLRIVDIIQEDYEEDGYTIITEAVDSSGAEVRKLLGEEEDSEDDSDEVVCSHQHLMAQEFCEQNKSYERSSFCERCDIHFSSDFVTWSFESRPEKRWFQRAYVNKYNHKTTWGPVLRKCLSSCRRCEIVQPSARVLWQHMRLWLRLKNVSTYWYELAHHPKYVATHAEIAEADLSSVFS